MNKHIYTMEEVMYFSKNNLGHSGENILNEFPYYIHIINSFSDMGHLLKCLGWLEDNLKKTSYTRVWVTQVYFKLETDAMAFKLINE
jgi:hypothetical protein